MTTILLVLLLIVVYAYLSQANKTPFDLNTAVSDGAIVTDGKSSTEVSCVSYGSSQAVFTDALGTCYHCDHTGKVYQLNIHMELIKSNLKIVNK